jgi:16S rRNA (cytosine967-C5)-methyltransferase
MTPTARVQAAIEVLDEILGGKAAEQALTGWARRSRYAGSKDRAAVRDHVFDALRCLRSHAAWGGAQTGRGLMLGALRRSGADPDKVFSDQLHAPVPLSEQERAGGHEPEPGPEELDIPDWLWPDFSDSLGADAAACARALQSRAPVHLRVNQGKGDMAGARQSLLRDGIETAPHPAASTALVILDGARRVRQSTAYQSGLVELQDAASQAVVEALPLRDGMRVLDYCAGGGGKALAMASRARLRLFAHDAAPQRMRDLPVRAERAGVGVRILATEEVKREAPFDLILCDVPCSGSGAWRRSPEGKWRLSEAALRDVCRVQSKILDTVPGLLSEYGLLAYVTCSVLRRENQAQIDGFLARHEGWRLAFQRQWTMQQETDGFFAAHLTRDGVGT